MLKTSYTYAKTNFAALCDEVVRNREVVIIGRSNGESVAMIAADELQSLLETAHLLRSPKNARRLLASLERAIKCQQPSGSGSAKLEIDVDRVVRK